AGHPGHPGCDVGRAAAGAGRRPRRRRLLRRRRRRAGRAADVAAWRGRRRAAAAHRARRGPAGARRARAAGAVAGTRRAPAPTRHPPAHDPGPAAPRQPLRPGGRVMTAPVPPRPDAQVHLGVFFQGVNHHTVWSDAESGSQIDPLSFERVVRTAERGLFDAFFLGEGLRLRESHGRLHDLDVVGRPDALTELAALAAVTSRIGLVATQNTTYNDPADLARRPATLDVLSGGRAAWNMVTTDNAWTGENFRRGGYLDHADRYVRAEEFVRAAQAIWDSWSDGVLAHSRDAADWAEPEAIARVQRSGKTVEVD